MPKVTHVDKSLKMNYDQILDKPFLVTTSLWSTTNTVFTELARLPFPSAIMNNPLARVPFESSAFYQARICCMLQVSGTPMHQGLLLAAAIPHGTPTIVNPNQILSAPHVFLNATESTSVCLECPMYTPSTLYRTATPVTSYENSPLSTSFYGTDIFDLVVFIMDPLSVASGSSTTISLSIHCIFKEADFYVPKVGNLTWTPQCGVERLFAAKSQAKVSTKCVCGEKKMSKDDTDYSPEGLVETLWKLPTKILDGAATGLKVVAGDLIDMGREAVRHLTGFHNPNISTIDSRHLATFRNFPNNVDQPVRLEVMDSHAQFSRIYDDYYFRTEQDEMDLKFLTSKPVYVGKFTVRSTNTTGKNLFAYPMTPMVEAEIDGLVGNTSFYSPLRTIYEASRYWRGDLKLHIQAVCTNFHFCKIIVVKNYAMSNAPVDPVNPLIPSYNQVHNLNTDTLEFSAGGQIHTIDLKYNSHLRQLECTKDYAYNIVNHGMVYGYLVQPLTFNSNVPLNVTFNVYISGGDNLEFSGYSLDPVDIVPGVPPTYTTLTTADRRNRLYYEITEEGNHTGRYATIEEMDKVKLIKRQVEFLEKKEPEYTVEKGDTWEKIAFITKTSVDRLRELNEATHSTKTPGYNAVFGPPLKLGEKLKTLKCWAEREQKPNPYCTKKPTYKPESGEEKIETLVKPNSQEEILNDMQPCVEDTRMSFRPNTSVRDYLRRMYPLTTRSLTPTTVSNVTAFDLRSLAMPFTNSDYFHAISSLYLGQSGGFKLKFKITGATCASAMYVPPASCIANGFTPIIPMANDLPTDAGSLASFTAGMTFNPSNKSYTAPQIEVQDYTRPSNNAGSAVTSRPGNIFELEMAIPNMNPFNFVGNAAKWANSTSVIFRDSENDFGVVYINFDASFDGTNYSPVQIIPFIGLNDEARLGYQVYCPLKTIPTYNATTPYVCRNSILRPAGFGAGFPNGIPVDPMKITGSGYYFNLT